MHFAPSEFRRMTLAEWRAAVDGFMRSSDEDMSRRAWQVSLQLVAAGCKAEDVSPAKLLGKEAVEREEPESVKRTKFDRLWARAKRKEAKTQGEVHDVGTCEAGALDSRSVSGRMGHGLRVQE